MYAKIEKSLGKSPETAITPSKLNNLAKTAIEKHVGSIWLQGEISDLYMAGSGHAYFSLKDSKSSIKCTFFKQYNFKNTVFKNGDSILAFGRATLYEERGTFQLKVERIESSGIGDMAQAYAALKLKLETLGYFSPQTKQTLPHVISSLAIVTSQSSAAVKDVLNVIKRRNPLLEIKIYHASVQGENAVEEIIDALLSADINKHDVILLTRGGGSEEDLWTFNDISIAQTLFNLSTVCVSAIGHERDTSISDLVADISAITPTAAGELLTPDLTKTKLKIKHSFGILKQIIQNKLNTSSQLIDIVYHKLEKSSPKNAILQEQQRLNTQHEKIEQLMNQTIQLKSNELVLKGNNLTHFDFNIETKKSHINLMQNTIFNHMSKKYEKSLSELKNTSNRLNTLSPLATLSRGYSITLKYNNQILVTDSTDITIGDALETIVETRNIISRVTDVKPR